MAYIPNAAGQALQRGSENILNIALQLNSQRVQREMQQERIEAQEAMALKGANLQMLGQVLSSAAPGTKLSDLPFAQQLIQGAGITEFDPNWTVNPETLQSDLQNLARTSLSELDPNDPRTERIINNVLGLGATSNEQMELQDLQTKIQRTSLADGWRDASPRQKQLMFENQVGIPPSVQFNVGGRTFKFESGQAASAALGFMNFELSRAAYANRNTDEMLRYREALKTTIMQQGMEIFGVGAARARAEAERILAGAYDSPEKVGSIDNPQVRAFVEAQLSARDLADRSIMGQFFQTPQGQALQATMQLGEQLSQFYPKEEIAKYLPPLTEALATQAGLPIARVRERGLLRSGGFSIPSNESLIAQQFGIPEAHANDPAILLGAMRGMNVQELIAAKEAASKPPAGAPSSPTPAPARTGTSPTPRAPADTTRAPSRGSKEWAQGRVTELRAELDRFINAGANDKQRAARADSARAKELRREIQALSRRLGNE